MVLNLIINKEVNNDDLIGTITCLDIYQDKKNNTKKKITVRISLRNIEKTLDEKDLKKITASISSKVAKSTGGILI